MNIVVIGVRGLIGSKVATNLGELGHNVIAASRRSGVDSLTGEGIADAIAGADLNPYAVAIARFRLLVAALHASEIRRLADARDYKIYLAVADSLLHGKTWGARRARAPGVAVAGKTPTPIAGTTPQMCAPSGVSLRQT